MKKYLGFLFGMFLLFTGSINVLSAETETLPPTPASEEKEFIGSLTPIGINARMWGTHELVIIEGGNCTEEPCENDSLMKVYPVSASNNLASINLKKYENRKVKILGKLNFYDLEGGFWGITAKEVSLVDSNSSCPALKEVICQNGWKTKSFIDQNGCKHFECLSPEKTVICPSGCSCKGDVNICSSEKTPTIEVIVNSNIGRSNNIVSGQKEDSDDDSHKIFLSKDDKKGLIIKDQTITKQNIASGTAVLSPTQKDESPKEGSKNNEDSEKIPTIMNNENFEVITMKDVSVINNKLSMRNSLGDEKIIEIMPKEIPKILEVESVQKAELKEQSEKPVYEVEGIREGKIFWVFSKNMDIKATVDAESGSIMSVKKPWWSFLFK